MTPRAKHLLTLDSSAACVAGLLMLALHEWLAAWYGLGRRLILLVAAVNLVYACYSGALAWRARRYDRLSRRAVDVLVAGNFTWPIVCLALVASTWPTSKALGVAHLCGEALFVAALAVAELRVVRPEADAP